MSLTRRAALAGATVSTAALAIPAVAVVSRSRVPAGASAQERFEYHFAEMAKALNELAVDAGGWRLQAGADSDGKPWRNAGLLTRFAVAIPGTVMPEASKGGAQ